VIGGVDSSGLLCDVATGKVKTRLVGHRNTIFLASFSPDGSTILTASRDGDVILWRIDGRFLHVLHTQSSAVRTARFRRDGARVLTASEDGTLRIWDTKTGVPMVLLAGHLGIVSDAAFSVDGTRVASASYDGTAGLWDISGEQPFEIARPESVDPMRLPPMGHAVALSWPRLGAVPPMAFSPPFYAFVRDGAVVLFDTSRHIIVHLAVQSVVTSMSFSSDGTRFASASADGWVWIWRTEGGELTGKIPTKDPKQVSFSRDGERLAIGTEGGGFVWNAASQQLVPLQGLGTVEDISFTSSDEILTATDGSARLWDGRTLEARRTFPHSGMVHTARMSPDGRWVVTTGENGTLVWNATTGGHGVLQGSRAVAASFSDDSLYIVTTSFDKTARIWDARTLRQLLVLPHPTSVVDGQFGDATHLVTEQLDGTVEFWEISSDKRAREQIATEVCSAIPEACNQ
jgi:WD40 repeat protein